jgi:hypothetical protein
MCITIKFSIVKLKNENNENIISNPVPRANCNGGHLPVMSEKCVEPVNEQKNIMPERFKVDIPNSISSVS